MTVYRHPSLFIRLINLFALDLHIHMWSPYWLEWINRIRIDKRNQYKFREAMKSLMEDYVSSYPRFRESGESWENVVLEFSHYFAGVWSNVVYRITRNTPNWFLEKTSSRFPRSFQSIHYPFIHTMTCLLHWSLPDDMIKDLLCTKFMMRIRPCKVMHFEFLVAGIWRICVSIEYMFRPGNGTEQAVLQSIPWHRPCAYTDNQTYIWKPAVSSRRLNWIGNSEYIMRTTRGVFCYFYYNWISVC